MQGPHHQAQQQSSAPSTQVHVCCSSFSSRRTRWRTMQRRTTRMMSIAMIISSLTSRVAGIVRRTRCKTTRNKSRK